MHGPAGTPSHTPLCSFLEGSLGGRQDGHQPILKTRKRRPRNVEPEGGGLDWEPGSATGRVNGLKSHLRGKGEGAYRPSPRGETSASPSSPTDKSEQLGPRLVAPQGRPPCSVAAAPLPQLGVGTSTGGPGPRLTAFGHWEACVSVLDISMAIHSHLPTDDPTSRVCQWFTY